MHLSVSSMRILFKLICIDFRNLQLMCLDNHGMRLVWFGYRYDMVSTSIIWFGYPGYEYDTAWIYPGYEYIQEMTISRKWIYPGNEYDMMVNSPSRGCGRSPGDCLGFQIQQMQEPVGAPCKKSMKLYYQLWRSRNAWTIEHCQGWWWRGRAGIERGDLEVLCKSCFDSLCPVPFSFSLLRVQLMWPKPWLWSIQIFKRVCLRSLLCVLRINRVRFSKHHFMLFWLAAVHIVRNAWEPVSLSSDE